MHQHHGAGLHVAGQVNQLLAISVATEVIAVDLSCDVGGKIQGGKVKHVPVGRRLQQSARRIRRAKPDKSHAVPRLAEDPRGRHVGRRHLDHHPRAEEVDGPPTEVAAGLILAGRLTDAEAFQLTATEVHLAELPVDGVKIIHQSNAQARAVSRHPRQQALLTRIGQDGNHLLHPPQRKNRQQHRAATLQRVRHVGNQAGHLRLAVGLDRALRAAPRRLHNQRVAAVAREIGPLQRPLTLKLHVTGVKNPPPLVNQLHPDRADNVTRPMQRHLQRFPRLVQSKRLLQVDAAQPIFELVDVALPIQRVFLHALLLPLPFHHVDRVSQHPGRNHLRRLGTDDMGTGVPLGRQRQRSQVVEVAVRQDNQVRRVKLGRLVVRSSLMANPTGVQASVDQNAKWAEFDPKRGRANAFGAGKVV